jgi:hypothetical protein
MTQIGKGAQGALGQGAAGWPGDGGLQAGRHPHARPDGRETVFHDGVKRGPRSAMATTALDRVATFQRSLRAAAGEDKLAQPDGHDPAVAHVLAVAEWRGGTLPPVVPQQASAPPDRPGLHPMQATIAAVTARIEQAVTMEHLAGTGAAVSLTVDLGGTVDGLQTLTVTVTAARLDVTLGRTHGDLSDELVHAAQALADRLSHRFATRTVRILTAVVESEETAGEVDRTESGMRAISGMLARPAPGT